MKPDKNMVDAEEMKAKIQKMKNQFEVQKRTIKKSSLDYAVNYYKEKSDELSQLFTNETIKLLNQYIIIRNDSLKKDGYLEKAIKYVNQQENIILELR